MPSPSAPRKALLRAALAALQHHHVKLRKLRLPERVHHLGQETVRSPRIRNEDRLAVIRILPHSGANLLVGIAPRLQRTAERDDEIVISGATLVARLDAVL